MVRRKTYTKVTRNNFSNPEHVKGMGDKTFRGFQCLNKECTNYLFIQTETIDPDFRYQCERCEFIHEAGGSTTLYDYELENTDDNSVIEKGKFEILHDDYVNESKEYKYCIVCGTLKPFELFDMHSSRRTGRQGECRVCKQVYNGIKNQTRLPEQHLEASFKRRLYTHFDDHSKVDIAEIYNRFENCCFMCGANLSIDLTAGVEKKMGNLDHTLPVFYLWPLTVKNATLLCQKHNLEKAQKWPKDFYNDTQLRKLSTLTGIDHKILAGEPQFNPEAIDKLKDLDFIVALFEKFSRYPRELLQLRNRILTLTDFDFLDLGAKISPDWKIRADELL